ncbi:hypothetical protein L198_07949 [Cryptococcus wingfieldii CBS 7118]|uniref:Uncharacterized protein n=1 Tax=Cryptococcus wingfieldii CBS 7118 TaxID=1295528 RepID=A0A1E3HRV9_9TREE|nr:hypothetical protein L198_07949 [Cryptococcus wingfieldii CBS 7118]ODN79067.1 hypothetical protein L198_07949 [Cryptococcus wingfieldii CBS 7118]
MTFDDKDHKNNVEEGGDTYSDDYEEFYSSSAQLLVDTLNQEIRSSPAYTETNTADSQAQSPSSLTFLYVKVIGKWSTSTGADGRRPGTLHPAHRHTVAEALSEMTEDTNSAVASLLPNSTPEETATLVQRTLSRMVEMMGFDGDVYVTPTPGGTQENSRLTTMQRESANNLGTVGSWVKGLSVQRIQQVGTRRRRQRTLGVSKGMDSKSYKSPSSSSILSLGTNKNQNQPTMSSNTRDQESTYSQMPTNASIRQEIMDEDPSLYTAQEADAVRHAFGGNGSSVPEQTVVEEQTATQASSDQQ